VVLGSASSWRKFNLELFQVDFDKDKCGRLPGEVDECTANEKD